MHQLLLDRYSGNAPTRSDPRPVNLLRLARDYNFIGTIDKVSMGGGPDAWQWHIAETDLVKEICALTSRRWERHLYHWIDPSQNWQRQLDHFCWQVEALDPDAVEFDIEQHDGDWGVPYVRIPPQKIYDATVSVIEGFKARFGIPWMPYSAKWFLEKYCPQLVAYFGEHPAWVASYADYGKTVRRMSRSEFNAWVDIVYNTAMPKTGTGVLRNPLVRQASSTIILPPCSSNYDVSVVLDDARYDAWIGGGQ